MPSGVCSMHASRSIRRWLNRAILIPAFCAALPLSGAAQDGPHWFTVRGDGGFVAQWGIPETDAVGFSVVCVEAERIMLRPALYAYDTPDELPAIRFTVDGTTYVRTLDLVFNQRDAAWQATTKIDADDAVIDALRRGNEVTYDFDPPLRPGDAFTVSLKGSADAIDEVLETC